MESWTQSNLGNICEVKYGKDHKKLDEGNIPCYGTGGIMRFVDKAIYDNESVLIPRKGSLNNIYYINQPFWTVDTLFWTKINTELVNPKFLFYNLKTVNFSSKDVGSAVPSLTTELLKKLEVHLPPLPEQEAIASILSAIDDKIELNLQMNKTLEDMAMALYKHWFVDFGPFQNGNFIESELGMIPEGWKIDKLESLLVLQRGFDLPKRKRISGNIPIYAASGKSSYHNEKKVDGPGITTGRSGVLGNVNFIIEDFWPLNTTLWIKKFVHSSPYHAFFLLKSMNLKEFNSGSAVPTLNRNDVHRQLVVKPSMESIKLFDEKVKNIFKLRFDNLDENVVLEKLRDTLLPNLISGKVRLKDFRSKMEEVL